MSFLFDKETIYRNHDLALREEYEEEYREKYKKMYHEKYHEDILREKKEAARRMLLKRKLSVEEIADYQNLTVEEVRELQAELLQKV